MLKKLGLAVIVVAATMSAACADTIKLGLQPWLGYGPLWVAKEKGFFEKNGVDVALTMFNWDQDLAAALASGNLDVVAGATNGMIAKFNQGFDQKGFLVMDVSFQADAILAGNGIGTVAALKGKKVAFESGSTSDLLINYALMPLNITNSSEMECVHAHSLLTETFATEPTCIPSFPR